MHIYSPKIEKLDYTAVSLLPGRSHMTLTVVDTTAKSYDRFASKMCFSRADSEHLVYLISSKLSK